MRAPLQLLVLAAAAAVSAGCFAPDYGSPSFACGADSSCPSGYECRSDGLCHAEGSPSVDARRTGDATRPDGGAPDGLSFVDAGAADAGGADAMTIADGTLADASPGNESCPGDPASVLVEGMARVSSLAGVAAGTPPSCLVGAHPDLYYPLELATDRRVTLQLTSVTDTALALYSDTCGVELACLNTGAGGEVLDLDSLPAGSYQIGVFAGGATAGDFSLGYTTAPPIVRPPNDQCAGALQLTSGIARTGQALDSALDDVVGGCGNGDDVVYRFDVPSGPNVRARVAVTNAAGFDPVVHIRQGACAGPSVGCAQAGAGTGETLDLTNLAPGAYYAWVEAVAPVAGAHTFDVLLDFLPAVPPPVNETCATATPLTAGSTLLSSTLGAADDLSLSCVPDGGADTTYALTLAAPAAVLVTATPTSPWGLGVALRPAASCEVMSDLACVGGAFGARRINQPNLAAGTYDVIIDGAPGAVGPYSLLYQTRPADLTFGYWETFGTETFTSIAGAAGASQVPVVTDAAYVPFSSADEGSYTIPLPFTFPFYGATASQVFAHVNGFLSVGTAPPSGAEAYNNDCPLGASEPNSLISLFWDDNYAVPVSQIWTRLEGTAPDRRLVIEYKDFDILYCTGGGTCSLLGARVTQQAVLYEDGDIELRYGPRTPGPTLRGCNTQHLGCGATIGIRGLGGTDSDLDQCNAGMIAAGNVIRFIAPR